MDPSTARGAGALLLALLASGCLLAAGGAAGGGIYFTSRGAGAVVQGSLPQVADAAGAAFERLGVEALGRKETDRGRGLDVYGRAGDDDVTVSLRRETDRATEVDVRVRKSAVTWDKEMARRILEEIRKLREP